MLGWLKKLFGIEDKKIEEVAAPKAKAAPKRKAARTTAKAPAKAKAATKAKAKAVGQRIGKYKFFIPPSAEDFKGLLYAFLSKGKVGEKQLQMFKENLFRPFARGIGNINNLKQSISNDFKSLKKQYPLIKKLLSKEIPTGGFTYDSAVRVYLWTKTGVEIPGLSKADQKELYNEVKNNPELKAFSDKLVLIPKITSDWLAPDNDWQVGNISSDINDITNKVSRKKYLSEWIDNKNEMFNEKNLSCTYLCPRFNILRSPPKAVFQSKIIHSFPSWW